MVITRNIEPYETIVRIMGKRAYIFTCSYKTAWEQYMTDEEKQGIEFKIVWDYLLHS